MQDVHRATGASRRRIRRGRSQDPEVTPRSAPEGLRAKQACMSGIKNARLFFGLEYAEDAREILDEPEGLGRPTIWVWPELQAFCARRHEMFEASFPQGMLGLGSSAKGPGICWMGSMGSATCGLHPGEYA